LKHVKRETIPTNRVMSQLQHDVAILKEQFSVMNNLYASEIVRLGIISHCCLSRIHQVIISIIPRVSIPLAEHSEVSQLVYELLRAIQQFKSPSNNPYREEEQ